MRTAVTQLANGVTTTVATPGWLAHTAFIDNPGGQWVIVPDADVTIAPFTVGVIVPLSSGAQSVRVSTIAPPGQINSGIGELASIVLASESLAANAGTQVSQARVTPALGYASDSGIVPGAVNSFSVNLAPNFPANTPAYVTSAELWIIPATAGATNVGYNVFMASGAIVFCWVAGWTGTATATGLPPGQRVLIPPFFLPAIAAGTIHATFSTDSGANFTALVFQYMAIANLVQATP